MSEIKYIKDYKTGNRFYPIVRSKGIVDAFNINEPQIDMLFGKVLNYSIVEDTYNIVMTSGQAMRLTLQLETDGPVDKSDIVWTSSNTEVATVDQDGYIYANNAGSAEITAQSELYNILQKIPITVDKLEGWTITYKSDVEVPNVWELVPESFRKKIPYHYSIGATYNQIGSQLNCQYKGSSYDTLTKTGQWFFKNPDISVLAQVTAVDIDPTTAEEDSFSPRYAATCSANQIQYGEADTEEPVQVTQDYSSITSLEYGDGPTILNCMGITSEVYPNLTQIILPSTLTTIHFGTGLFGNSLYRNLPSVVEGMDYTFNVHKNISNIPLTKWSSDAYPSNLGPGHEFSVFKYITVDPENTVYDSRQNCNAIIETANNTLIAGCCNTIIPDTVTSIADSAIVRCPYRIEEMVIPNTVTSIGKGFLAGSFGGRLVWQTSATLINLGCQFDELIVDTESFGAASTSFVHETSNYDRIIFTTNVRRIRSFNTTWISIMYEGTMAQWGEIIIDEGVSLEGITINCSDGTITL